MKKLSAILLLLALLFATISPALAATVNDEAQEHILNELRRAWFPNAAIAVIQDRNV